MPRWTRDICIVLISILASLAVSYSHSGPRGLQGNRGLIGPIGPKGQTGDSPQDLGICFYDSVQMGNGQIWISDIQLTTPQKFGNGWSCAQGSFVSVKPN